VQTRRLSARLAGSAKLSVEAIAVLNLQVAGTQVGCWLRRPRPVETQSSSSWNETGSHWARGGHCRKWWTRCTRFQTIPARRMSSATSHRAGRSTTRVLNPPRRKGTVLERPEILYTAEAAATGGRAGHAATSDGRVDVELDLPKEMGGSGARYEPGATLRRRVCRLLPVGTPTFCELTRDTRQHRGHADGQRLQHRAAGRVSCP